jgi:hypothetical protein
MGRIIKHKPHESIEIYTLCTSLMATTSIMAQVKQTEQRRIGNWVVIEEYEITDEDENISFSIYY